MEELAASLSTAGTWLVGIGLVLFIGGLLVDAFGTAGAEAKTPVSVIGEVISKAFAILFDGDRPMGQRISAGGVLLIGLGILALVAGIAASIPAGDGAGSGADPSPSPSSS